MENSGKLTTEDVNRMNAEEYTPAIVLMTLIVIIGLSGNTLAAIFYIRKVQKSVIQFSISCLSINDAVTNALLVQEVVQLFYYLSQDNIIICKLFLVVKHWLIGNSLLLMVAIAIDRYRRICFPFSKQLTYPWARCIIFGLTAFSFLMASRNIATVDVLKFNITAVSNSTITGFYCSQSKKADFAQMKTIFHVVDISIHGIVMFAFVLVNILLLRKIIKTKEKLKGHRTLVSFKDSKNFIETRAERPSRDIVQIDLDGENNIDQNIEKVSEKEYGSRSTKEQEPELSDKHKSSTLQGNNGTLRRSISHIRSVWIEIKITLMVVMITVISALCFIPYYVAMLTVEPDFSGSAQVMTVAEILARRSYMLNSAVNPFIMLVFNVPFRKFVLDIICRLCMKFKK